MSGAVCGAGRCNASVALNNTSPDVVAFWTKMALVDDCGAGCAATYAPPPCQTVWERARVLQPSPDVRMMAGGCIGGVSGGQGAASLSIESMDR